MNLQKILEPLPKGLSYLPEKYRWTLHNIVAHPLAEILFHLGFVQASGTLHDLTIPRDSGNDDD